MNQQSKMKQAGSYGEGRHSSRHWRTRSVRHWRGARRGYGPAAGAGAPVVPGYARMFQRSADEDVGFGSVAARVSGEEGAYETHQR
jgi:hypothetical protein